MEIMKESVLQFEYKIMTYYGLMEVAVTQDILRKKNTSSEDVLNELGKDGWELVSVLQYSENSTYIFKRAKWVEKKAQEKQEDNANKIEPKFKVGDFVKDTNHHKQPIYKIVYIDKECYICESDDVTLGDKAVMHFAFDNPYLRLVEQHKFHVDDWICNSACIVHIASIKDGMYYFDEGDGLDITFVDNNYHLWSINDAKDGDVLSYENEVFIVKKSINLNILYYCCYDGEHFIIDSFYSLTIDDINNIRPATKEQRNILFQKMKENGYEWNADKKELKKIETPLPYFDEQQGSPIIEIPFCADNKLQEASYHIPEGFYAEIYGDNVVIKKGEKKSYWSKEDEQLLKCSISNLREIEQRFGTVNKPQTH